MLSSATTSGVSAATQADVQADARVAPHIPVLLGPVLEALAVQPGAHVIDGTYGAGGYTRALLAAGARVTAFDRDPDALAAAPALPGLTLIAGCFSTLDQAAPADAVVLDIGVSSMQLDRAERGFSFQADGPLDMRMARSGPSAADFLNEADEAAIADVLYHFGEEPRARRIARAIVAERPILTTLALADLVARVVGRRPGERKHPATRVFQALRIHVNAELEALTGGLEAAERALIPGGRLAVVSFHSLEDRIVKGFLRDRSGASAGGSRHRPALAQSHPPTFEGVARAIRPDARELAQNPRARSATLRSGRRTSAPARTQGPTPTPPVAPFSERNSL